MSWVNAKKDIRQQAFKEMIPCSNHNGMMLEFGAFASPTFVKNECDIFYADRLSTVELQRTVTNKDKRNAIVDVDFVLGNDSIKNVFSDSDKFDVIIANHVIEHIPDVISWLNEINSILSDKGFLFLSIPDKNFTHDIAREPTVSRELVSNYINKKKRPSVSDIFDSRFHRKDIKVGMDVWSGNAYQKILGTKFHSSDAQDHINKLLEEDKGEYTDTHVNVFTEQTFLNVFAVIDRLNICNLELFTTLPVKRPFNEFYASFKKRLQKCAL